ncbi:MAG: NB-ARC domain-containing protein [Blastocatellia bacterium]
MSDQLKPAIVRIFNQTEDIVGGGFLVSERHIITCAHVVNLSFRRSKSNTDKPNCEITLDFPLIAPGRTLKAELIEWFPEDEFSNQAGEPQDIAVLKLKEDPPAGCAAAALVFGNFLKNHDCAAFGFSKPEGRVVPVVARGEIVGGRIQIDSRAELTIPQKPSGAFIIPTSVLVEAWPELRDRVRSAVNMAEPPPDDFVARPEEFNKLLNHLLDPARERPVAIGATAALRGAGGYGKTTLAKALCHDPQIQSAFKDGILWVTIGETPGNLAAKLDDLTYALSGKKPGSESIEAAITEFKKHLEGREILIVVDDVWAGEHLRPFLQGGQRCARLITTRIQNVIPPNAHKVEVDAMRIGEAVKLLAAGFENDPDRPGIGELSKLAATLGEWPLLLKLANGSLRNRVANGDSFRDALDFINADLEENGLTAFDSENEKERNRAVRITLGVSFKLLKDSDLARFNDLAVFPEDVNVPLDTVEKFWARTSALSRVNSQKLCERLQSLSLLLDFSLKEKRIRLHDVIRKYLIEQQRDRLPEIHAQLLDALHPGAPAPRRPVWSEMPDDEPYLWDHLAFHLIGAGRGDELVATVKDWRYLAKKTLLKKSLSVEGDLVKAEEIAPADDPLRTLRRNYVNSGHLFNHCETGKEVNETIFVRLQHLNELKTMPREMAQSLDRPYVAQQSALPDLPHPALIRTLEGHSAYVSGCAFSHDSKLIVSASADRTLKVWDAESGACVASFYADGPLYCRAFGGDNLLIVAGGVRGVYFLKLER